MAEDRKLTISSSSHLHPDEVARHTFGTSRRGFDPSEVREYLEQLARELVAASERAQRLQELLEQAEHRAQNPVLDGETLTTALGQETARVLRSAHEAASELKGRAEADANRMLTEAQEDAGKLQARAEEHASERAAQSEAAAAQLRQRANEEAAAKLQAAQAEAETHLEHARAECRAMLSEAQELRARVLGDLTRRRRVLHSQIEQLRAGRHRLAETIGGVRDAVDKATDDLFRAEDEARIAAEAAGRQLAIQTERAELALASDSATPAAPEDIGSRVPERSETVVQSPPESENVEAHELLPGEEETLLQAEQGDGPSPSEAVEELFARLRAEHISEPTVVAADPEPKLQASTLQGEDGALTGARGAVEGPDIAAQPVEGSDVATEQIEGSDVAADQVGGSEVPAEQIGGSEVPAEQIEGSEHEPLLGQRDEVLGPVMATLARRLKRALSDDQNDILDRLRASKGWKPDVLPSEVEHLERYTRAGWEQLVEAARSGATFSGGKSSDAPGVEDIASDLAAAIVVPLRRRLEGEGAAMETGDDAALVEHVGGAFRDWKGARVERLAGDQAVAAFSRAAVAVIQSGSTLRWLVDDDGVQCPDCDDNALAGPVPRGDTFPTGHPHPPAHAGCRCLVAPMDA